MLACAAMAVRYVHLHGFASSRTSTKGQKLAAALASHEVELELPDLNCPSFAQLTYTACLQHIDALLADASRVRLSGSSMGGYLAALWAARNPTRVERLLLLCPGFDLPSRWPQLVGAPLMAQWERDGVLPIPDRSGNTVLVHWEFITDARGYPTHPDVPCPTLIVHGTRDDVVPIESSRAYARGRDHVRLVEVDDVHTLQDSTTILQRLAVEHLLEHEGS